MNSKSITKVTDANYELALREIEYLMLLPENELDENELERLAILIEEYENIYYPIE